MKLRGAESPEAEVIRRRDRRPHVKRLMNAGSAAAGGATCPRTRAFLMAHASTLTINIYRTRQEGALYLLVN